MQKKWLWAMLLLLPLGVGSLVYANVHTDPITFNLFSNSAIYPQSNIPAK